MRDRRFGGVVMVALLAASGLAGEPFFLRRQLQELAPRSDDLTTPGGGAIYRPVFGVGAAESERLRGVARYGELTVAPDGASAVVSYAAEEQIYYILEGDGTLLYDDQKVRVGKDDFMYLPPGCRHGVSNPGAVPLRLIVMGYRIPEGRRPEATPKLLIANAADVPLQVLPSHGPTTQFKLLMGQTTSRRDRLAAASEMTSLFIMDFAAAGTNIPHSHASEEEIYLLLRGSGEIVAGREPDGGDARHAAREGAVFFFGPGTRVGYYSGAREGQEHDLILAVRSRLP